MAFDGLQRIGQIALHVGDVDEAVRFYRDALGMRFLFQAPPRMAFFDCGGIRLLLGEPEPEAGGAGEGGQAGTGAGAGAEAREVEPAGDAGESGVIVYFDVPDIRAAHQALEARGVVFEEGPRKVAELEDAVLWLAFFRDPWGNTLALSSEVAG